jgi:hypothetical protein
VRHAASKSWLRMYVQCQTVRIVCGSVATPAELRWRDGGGIAVRLSEYEDSPVPPIRPVEAAKLCNSITKVNGL